LINCCSAALLIKKIPPKTVGKANQEKTKKRQPFSAKKKVNKSYFLY